MSKEKWNEYWVKKKQRQYKQGMALIQKIAIDDWEFNDEETRTYPLPIDYSTSYNTLVMSDAERAIIFQHYSDEIDECDIATCYINSEETAIQIIQQLALFIKRVREKKRREEK